MNKYRKNLDIYFLLLMMEIFMVTSFVIFEIGDKSFSHYFFMLVIFFLIVMSYFNGIIPGLISSAIIVFGYGSYSLYANVVSSIDTKLDTYVMLVAFPLAAFIAGRFAENMNFIQERNMNLEEQLKNFVTIDEITGLNNTKSFYTDLDKEMSRSRRHNGGLSVMVIQMQYYSELMSLIGPQKVNSILREIGASIRKSLRNEDSIYKLANDMFGIIMPNTEAEGARVVMDRMRNEFKEIALTNSQENEKFNIDVKIGMLEYDGSIKSPFEFKELVEKELEFDV